MSRHCDGMSLLVAVLPKWHLYTASHSPVPKHRFTADDWSQLNSTSFNVDLTKRFHPFTFLAQWMLSYTYTRLTALCPGLPRWTGTRKVKSIWILLKQETVSGSGISWAICWATSLQTDNHASTPPLSFFTGRMPFLPPNQQRQSTVIRKVKCPLNLHHVHRDI